MPTAEQTNDIKAAQTLLHGLAQQVQLLACLSWLGEFQVLACIPLTQSVSYAGLADLIGVPVEQLRRIVRMTATAGFLCESQPGHVAHSPLSAQFVKRPSLSDALTFLSSTAVPTALCMPEATRRIANPQQAHITAYNVASNSSESLGADCEKDPRLLYKLDAFQRFAINSVATGVIDVLSPLDWRGLGEATVVEVGARSKAAALTLSKRAPNIKFVVQMADESEAKDRRSSSVTGSLQQADGRDGVEVQVRKAGTPQTVDDASVYVLHLPWPSFCASSAALRALCIAELRVHFNLLRARRNATLILITPFLPEPGSVDAKVEAFSRVHDLFLHQMGNSQSFDMSELSHLLEAVQDGGKRFVTTNTLSSPHHPIVALELQVRS